MRRLAAAFAAAALLALALLASAAGGECRFVIAGDRTGEAQPGVWQRVWKEIAAARPDFVVSVGDLIQGTDDATAEVQWRDALATLEPYRGIPIFFTPGNHDVWSQKSAALYRSRTGRPLHYGFDYGPAHFTVLDNSRSDILPASEMEFLQADLAAHQAAAARFIVMHRPSWILDAAMGNASAPLQQMARRWGVRWIVAGHVHQLIHAEVEGVTYFAAPSAGGHLRLSGKYEDGWFFGWTEVEVKSGNAVFSIHELAGRKTPLASWGLSGLR
ncbi:MAG: metallophosphoesterase [Acidobacteria bacterium]|nr:metallophosphoesterase [Acidobacteriota bacterium]